MKLAFQQQNCSTYGIMTNLNERWIKPHRRVLLAVALAITVLMFSKFGPISGFGPSVVAAAFYFWSPWRRLTPQISTTVMEWLGVVLIFSIPTLMATLGKVPGAAVGFTGLGAWLWTSTRGTNKLRRSDPWHGEP